MGLGMRERGEGTAMEGGKKDGGGGGREESMTEDSPALLIRT